MADRSVVVRLTAIVGGYTASMGEAAAATKKFSSSALTSIESNKASIRTLGTTAVVAGGAILAGFAVGADAALKFQTAMAGVNTTVKATPAEISALGTGIRGLAKDIPVTREALAGLVEQGAKLGIATPNLLSFAKTMAEVGADTNLSAEDAGKGLAQLAAVTQLPQNQIHNLASALVDLGNKTKSSESDTLRAAQSIAGASHLIGLSAPQVLAFGNAVASLGGGGAAGLAVTTLFTKMDAAVATGGDKLKIFAQVAGETTSQFKQQFQTDSAGAVTAFLTGLDGIQKHGGDALSVLNSLSLGGSRGARVIAGLASTHVQLARSLGISTSAFQANDAVTIEANTRWSTAQSQLKIMENRLSDVAVTLGNTLLPILNDTLHVLEPFVSLIGTVAGGFAALPAPVRDTVIALGLFAGAGLVVTGIVSKIVLQVAAARAALATLTGSEAAAAAAGAGGAAAEGAGGLAAIFGGASLAGTIGLATGAAVVFGGAMAANKKTTDDNKKAIQQWAEAIISGSSQGIAKLKEFEVISATSSDPRTRAAAGIAVSDIKAKIKDLTDAAGPAAAIQQKATNAQTAYADAVARFGPKSSQATAALKTYNSAAAAAGVVNAALTTAQNNVSDSSSNVASESDRIALSLKNASNAATVLGNQFQFLFGKGFSLAQSQLQVDQATQTLTDDIQNVPLAISAYTTAIAKHGASSKEAISAQQALSKATLTVRGDVLQSVSAMEALREAQIQAGTATHAADAAFGLQAAALFRTQQQAGATTQQLHTYLATLGLTPRQISTILALPNAQQAQAILDAITKKLDHVAGAHKGSVDLDTSAANAALDALDAKIAASQHARLVLQANQNPPTHASGAFVNGPQLALIGEAGPEVVLPLTRPMDMVKVLQQSGASKSVLLAAGRAMGAAAMAEGGAAGSGWTGIFQGLEGQLSSLLGHGNPDLAGIEKMARTYGSAFVNSLAQAISDSQSPSPLQSLINDAKTLRSSIEDNKHALGALSDDAYIKILRERQREVQKYSDAWTQLQQQIVQVSSDAAAKLQTETSDVSGAISNRLSLRTSQSTVSDARAAFALTPSAGRQADLVNALLQEVQSRQQYEQGLKALTAGGIANFAKLATRAGLSQSDIQLLEAQLPAQRQPHPASQSLGHPLGGAPAGFTPRQFAEAVAKATPRGPLIENLVVSNEQEARRQFQRVKDREDAIALSF